MPRLFQRMVRRAPLALAAAVALASSVVAAPPEIWFSPEDPVKRPDRADTGGNDYLDLFTSDADWKQAASRVQVFEIYPQFLARGSDEMLRTVIEGLKARHIALAVSYGLLHRPKDAAMHEGYGAEVATKDIARLKRLGADVRYVVADEPLLFGHFYWGEGATPLSIAEVAADAASTARQFRDAFPGVRIGMDDPILLYRTAEWEPAMREFLEAYQKAFGEPMAFVRLECASFQVREWLPRYLAAERLLRSMGVDFGQLITGDATDTSDAQWLAKAEERYATWESEGRSAPAQMVFQSWMPRPTRLLPESQPDAFTHLLNGYFRERVSLEAKRDGRSLHSFLLDASGHPVAGAAVECSYLPGFSDPTMIHRVVTGTTPTDARFVQVGLRIGMEGSRDGTAQLTMGPTHYREERDGGVTAQFDFEKGVAGWGTHGTASVTPAKTASGEAGIHIAADAGQSYLLNSKLQPATGEHPFRCEFNVELQPATETGYLVIFFFNAERKVIGRFQEPLVSTELRTMPATTTDSDGKVQISLESPALKDVREFRLVYRGDALRRPAFAVIR